MYKIKTIVALWLLKHMNDHFRDNDHSPTFFLHRIDASLLPSGMEETEKYYNYRDITIFK